MRRSSETQSLRSHVTLRFICAQCNCFCANAILRECHTARMPERPPLAQGGTLGLATVGEGYQVRRRSHWAALEELSAIVSRLCAVM